VPLPEETGLFGDEAPLLGPDELALELSALHAVRANAAVSRREYMCCMMIVRIYMAMPVILKARQ
jgi:hypothetical protein